MTTVAGALPKAAHKITQEMIRTTAAAYFIVQGPSLSGGQSANPELLTYLQIPQKYGHVFGHGCGPKTVRLLLPGTSFPAKSSQIHGRPRKKRTEINVTMSGVLESKPPDMDPVGGDANSTAGASEHRQICPKTAVLPSNPVKNVYHGIF